MAVSFIGGGNRSHKSLTSFITGSCKYNYHMITTMRAPSTVWHYSLNTKVKIIIKYKDYQTTINNNLVKFEQYCLRNNGGLCVKCLQQIIVHRLKSNNFETTKVKIVKKDVDPQTIIPINLRGGKIERVCCGYLCQTDRHTTVYHNTSYLKMEYNKKKKILIKTINIVLFQI